MRTYWKSEAPKNSYYIKYSIEDKEVEFWTDNEEDFYDKLGFINRHITYRLLNVCRPT